MNESSFQRLKRNDKIESKITYQNIKQFSSFHIIFSFFMHDLSSANFVLTNHLSFCVYLVAGYANLHVFMKWNIFEINVNNKFMNLETLLETNVTKSNTSFNLRETLFSLNSTF